MSRTDFFGRGSLIPILVSCCFLLTITLTNSLQAEGGLFATLVCDDQINVALNGDCESEITVDMILEGESSIPNFDPADYSIEIEGPNGPVNGVILDAVGLYTVTVSEAGSGPNNLQPPYNSCWGHILVEDKLPPQLLSCPCPPGNTDPDCVLPLLCEDLLDLDAILVEAPQAYDNCNNNFTITFDDDVNGVDCSTSTVTRTWRLTDDDGNFVTCVSEYRIDPMALTGQIVAPKQHIDLDCGIETSPEGIYEYFANEYRTLNSCGSYHSSCDPDDPYYDEDVAAAYELEVHRYATMFAYPSINDIVLIGNICSTVTSYDDTVIPICSSAPGCEGNAKIIRTWTIYDWCDPNLEPIKYTQVIKASDNTDPSIDAHSFSTSVDPWGCTATVRFPEPDHLTDNCASYVTYTVTGSGSSDIVVHYDPDLGYYATDVPVGEHTFYYNAFDCCDNTSSEGIVVTVYDATPPVAITKQDIVVSLIPNPGDLIEPGLTKIFAESVDNGSFDGCGPVKLEIRRETESCGYANSVTYNDDFHSFDSEFDGDNGRYVTFCCNDLAEYGVDEDGDGFVDYAQIKVWLRVWDDGDGDGIFGTAGDNYSEVWSFVRLEDKSRPTIICPPDKVIDCDADSGDLVYTGSATAVSSCGPVGVYYQDIHRDLSGCNEGVITRRWYVEGFPEIYCDQRITLSGQLIGGPIVVNFPEDTVVTCADYLQQEPTWIAGTCDQMAYSVDRDTFFFADGACFKVLNYWTVINWCTYNPTDPYSDGIWTDVQVVKIIDDTAPRILECVDTSFVVGANCQLDGIMLTNRAEDIGLCASNRLSWTVQVDLNSDWSIDYTYSSTAPVNSGFYIPPSRSGQEVKITLPEGVHGSMTSHTVTWKVSDGCGNITSCTSSFMVIDNKPPTPYCVNLSTALMENGQVELWACDFDLGAFDNCSDQEDLRFTFTNVRPQDDPSYNPITKCSSKIFTCDDIEDAGGEILTLNIYVWDEKDNSDFCTVFLTLIDNNDSCEDIGNSPVAQIGGTISNSIGAPLENVEVSMISSIQPEFPSNGKTDKDGHYTFSNNVMYQSYELSGYNNSNPLNGVSTLDIVLIQRHILGLETLDSPHKLIAADINSDADVTAYDLVELRKLILGIYEELPDNDSWVFINDDDILDVNNPWPLPMTRFIQDLDNNMMQEDFVGIKIGDVNNTASANILGESVDKRSANSISIDFEDVSFEAGETVELVLKSDDLYDVAGIQFTLESDILELVSAEGLDVDINDENIARISQSQTNFSWNSKSNKNIGELMTLRFVAKSSGIASESIRIASDKLRSEAYVGESFEVIPVKLSGRNNTEQNFELFQNKPNPFNGSTTVSFVLPTASEATLTIMDVTGRVLWTYTDQYEMGTQSIIISERDINATGVLYYQLEAGDFSSVRKMIIIE